MTVVQVDLPAGVAPDPDPVAAALTAAGISPDDVRVNGRALHALYRRDLTETEMNTARGVAVEAVFNPPTPPVPEPVSPQRVADLEAAVAALAVRLSRLEPAPPSER